MAGNGDSPPSLSLWTNEGVGNVSGSSPPHLEAETDLASREKESEILRGSGIITHVLISLPVDRVFSNILCCILCFT